ncbi:MAG: 3-oxoacyl-ACP synthase III [Candidatus Sumerlaeota bacterium]
MRYNRVYIDSFGYELPPVVVSTAELEDRLHAMYKKLHIAPGQLEYITGISERRWWNPGFRLSDGAIAAGRKALENSSVTADDLDILIYGSVCREHFEPATACRVADGLGIRGRAEIFDISNACLGVVNGMVDIANRIELGQIRAGMVVGCETAREINEIMIERMLGLSDMESFTKNLATLTGGSGAAAVLLTDGSFSEEKRRKIIGGVAHSAPEHHELCIWGLEAGAARQAAHDNREIRQEVLTPFTCTDSAAVLKNGVALGVETWSDFLKEVEWKADEIDKTVCHQVGKGHQDAVLAAIGVTPEKDYATYPYLGNVGTVSLPISAALAEEREFVQAGQKVGFLGIGSGLNCLILGVEW